MCLRSARGDTRVIEKERFRIRIYMYVNCRKNGDVEGFLGSDNDGRIAQRLLVLVPGEQAQVLVALYSSLLHLRDTSPHILTSVCAS
jgi:hypothetical protein